MRYLYSFLLFLLTPFLLVRLWWKGRKLPAYRQRIAERFCVDRKEAIRVSVWVHAVSLGEVIAATPLIEAMLKKNCSVLVTTMTPTGAEQVKKSFGDRVLHRYVPYDLLGAVKRFFTKVHADVGVIMETELWPNLVAGAARAHLPLFLVNARLSEKALRGYLKGKFLFKPLLNQFTALLIQSEDDASRFKKLGASPDKVRVLGNIKFDLQTQNIDKEKYSALRMRWGNERPVVIIASTHDNEEALILQQLRRLQTAIPEVILLIAPRHPERFQAVYQLCIQSGFNTGLRSDLSSLNESNDVVVLDCLGELLGLYQISDYAFVGGSFVPVGGHNVLEPIAMHIPVLSGHHVHNFKTICRDLVAEQAMIIVHRPEELIDQIIQLHQSPQLRQEMVCRASAVLDASKGAVDRYLEAILEESVDISTILAKMV